MQPPPLTFNPEIDAKLRASKRGLSDTEGDIKTSLHFGHTDLLQALKNITVGTSRKREDINREADRGQRKLGYEEQDAKTKAGRANQDFNTQLATIGRQFAQLGHRQAEGANAAGVLDAGTQAAAAAARSRNQGLAEAPINTARARTNEDLLTALGRIETGRGELSSDTAQSLGRLNEDRDRQRLEARRQFGRERFKGHRDLERARREGAITGADLREQEVYNARAEHPKAFGAWVQSHPGVLSSIKNKPKQKGKR